MIHSPTREGETTSVLVVLRVLANMRYNVNLNKSAISLMKKFPLLGIEYDTINVILSLAVDSTQ